MGESRLRMVSIEKAVVARLKTHGENFEILVDPKLALDYKNGKEVDLMDMLAIDQVFKDSGSAEKASEHLMTEVLGTTKIEDIVDKIIKKGEISLTTEQRKEMLDEKRRKIVSIITRNAIDPKTGNPHPPARIEKAMEEARVSINIFKSAKEQIEPTVKKIRPLLPIKFQVSEIAVKIPAQYSGNAYSVLKEFGTVKKEEWNTGGELLVLLEIPAGLRDEVYNRLNSMTHGDVEIKLVK